MKANEIEIATANVIVLDYGKEKFPEIDVFIWQWQKKRSIIELGLMHLYRNFRQI